MQDYLAHIDSLIGEHEQYSAKIGACDDALRNLASIRQNWIPGHPDDANQELNKLEQALDTIGTELEEHMHIEEQEALPILTKYAADIIRHGVLYEHRAILQSISDLREHARDLFGKSADREEVLNKEARVRESIGDISELLREHAQMQDTIYNLAREAMAKESEHEIQP